MTKKTYLVFLCLLLLGVVPLAASDYSISSYSVEIDVARDAVLHVDEKIDAMFFSPLHGIFREIPVGYLNGQRAKVSDIRSNRPSEIYESGKDYLKIRFGEEDVLLRGSQSYELTYSYDVGADQNDGYDELYYNIIGDGWQETIETCDFSIVFPSSIDPSLIFFTRGIYGSTSSDGVTWKVVDGNRIEGTALNFVPGENLTVRVQLPDGYYVGAREIINRTPFFFGLTIAGCLVAIGFAVLIWFRFGKDVPTVFYAASEPPDGMTPMQVGYLADSHIDDKDITSMLFYWADRGLLKIEQGEKTDSFVFTKLGENESTSPGEKYLFDSFFSCGQDNTVKEEDLSDGFYEKMEKAKTKLKDYFKGERRLTDAKSQIATAFVVLSALIPIVLTAVLLSWDYIGFGTFVVLVFGFLSFLAQFAFVKLLFNRWYVMNMSRYVAAILTFIPTLLLIVFSFIANYLFEAAALQSVGTFICAVTLGIISFFAAITEKRSAYGQKVLEMILGYREFLEKVEMDRLKLMIDSDPQVFYHNLSYAIVLGLEDKWARKFDGIAMAAPIWYSGHDLVFDAFFYSHLARSWNRQFALAVMPKSSSSGSPGLRVGGSSFGGSGFSGGGFSGGGGGAW